MVVEKAQGEAEARPTGEPDHGLVGLAEFVVGPRHLVEDLIVAFVVRVGLQNLPVGCQRLERSGRDRLLHTAGRERIAVTAVRQRFCHVRRTLLEFEIRLAAVRPRRFRAAGRRLEQPLAVGPLPFLTWSWAEQAVGGGGALDTLLGGACPCYRIYRCGDGKSLSLAALEPKFWSAFVELIGADRHQTGDEKQYRSDESDGLGEEKPVFVDIFQNGNSRIYGK